MFLNKIISRQFSLFLIVFLEEREEKKIEGKKLDEVSKKNESKKIMKGK